MSKFIDPAKVPKRRLYTGEEIPCIGMGTCGSDRFSAEEISNAVYGAVQCGYRLFDCASVYQNEDQIGEVFEKAFRNGLVKREELHITSKVWNDMHGKGDVLLSLAKTLKCEIKPVLIEMELHPCFQQQELFDYCVGQGIQPIGFCPIGSPTRPERDKTAEDVADIQVPEVAEIAKAHNVHPAVICLKWAVQRGQIPIPFSIYENEYVSNLRCTVEDPLTEKEMEVMKTVDRNCRLVKGQVFLWEGAKGWEDLWDLDGTITK